MNSLRIIGVLERARKAIQEQVNTIYDEGGVEYLGLGSILEDIDSVLKDLNNEPCEAPHAK